MNPRQVAAGCSLDDFVALSEELRRILDVFFLEVICHLRARPDFAERAHGQVLVPTMEDIHLHDVVDAVDIALRGG